MKIFKWKLGKVTLTLIINLQEIIKIIYSNYRK